MPVFTVSVAVFEGPTPPVAGSPVAVPMFVTLPRSKSACVNVYVARQVNEAFTARDAFVLVPPLAQLIELDAILSSVTITLSKP